MKRLLLLGNIKIINHLLLHDLASENQENIGVSYHLAISVFYNIALSRTIVLKMQYYKMLKLPDDNTNIFLIF